MNVYQFKDLHGGFDYVFEHDTVAGEEFILEMPYLSANKKGICDIAWQADGDISLYGTLSQNPQDEVNLWQEISAGSDINKGIRALKIVGISELCHVIVRVLLYGRD